MEAIGFCKLFDYDTADGIILEERITPGSKLSEKGDLEKRLNIFSILFKELHIQPANPKLYPTYMEWIDDINSFMKNSKGFEDFTFYMEKARDVCFSLNSLYQQPFLLHGDIHHGNILSCNTGGTE